MLGGWRTQNHATSTQKPYTERFHTAEADYVVTESYTRIPNVTRVYHFRRGLAIRIPRERLTKERIGRTRERSLGANHFRHLNVALFILLQTPPSSTPGVHIREAFRHFPQLPLDRFNSRPCLLGRPGCD